MLAIAFDRAIVLGLAKKNPARMIGNVKSRKPKIDFWTLEEFQKVISLLYKGDYYEHYLFISYWLLFMTGMRIGEAAALQWSDIDFETGVLSINKNLYYKTMTDYKFVETKTQASIRDIIIYDDTLKELKEWKEVQQKVLQECIFILSYNGTPTSKTPLPRALERLAKFLRRSCASPPIDVIALIGRELIAVRPDRRNPRYLRARTATTFQYR